MKVTLLAINAKYVHSSLSVWVIAAGLTKYARRQYDVSVVEATIHQTNEEIAGIVAAHHPDVVGISVYIWNAAKLTGLIKLLRETLPETVIALGGPEAEHNADYWMSQGADHVLPGEGEYVFPSFLDNLSKMSTDASCIPDICEPVDPYSNEYFNALKGRLAYLETSRGCPFKCEFCLSAGSGVKMFPIDAVKERIKKLSKCGVRTIKLVDRTFNSSAARAYELLEYIIGLETESCFHFEAAADLFDDRTLDLISSAPPGRIQIEVGFQSFYEPALDAVSRKTDLLKAERSIKILLSKKNIHIHIDLIAGLPYETLEAFKDSFDRAYALGAHTLQLGFLKLLHGSVLRDKAEKLGIRYSAEPPYTVKSSPWLSADDISVLKQTENALRHTYNKRRFLSALTYTHEVTGMRPFSLYQALGSTAPNYGTQLEFYADQVFDFFSGLPGVCKNKLRDCMLCDWLAMVKGKNMPKCLKKPEMRLSPAVMADAETRLGRKPGRGEAVILHSGKTVIADSSNRDPVTNLYKLIVLE